MYNGINIKFTLIITLCYIIATVLKPLTEYMIELGETKMLDRTEPCVSFAVGVGSILAICPTVKPTELTPLSNNSDNISYYWENVGNHLRAAIKQVNNEQSERK